MKTGQVNPDRPLVGPSVDTFVGCFVASPRRAENKEISPCGCSRGGSRGGARGPTRGATGGSTCGSNFAFACSVCRPSIQSLCLTTRRKGIFHVQNLSNMLLNYSQCTTPLQGTTTLFDQTCARDPGQNAKLTYGPYHPGVLVVFSADHC